MCWHGLPAYWGGIMPGAPALAGISDARIVFPKPTESIAEIEPSLMWSPAVLAGWGPSVAGGFKAWAGRPRLFFLFLLSALPLLIYKPTPTALP